MAEPGTHQPDPHRVDADQPETVLPPTAPIRRRTGWFSWLVLFVVATAAISLAAVYLPARVKMLGLFAIAQGLVAGWVAARLARAFHVATASQAVGSVVAFVVILGGQIATTVESHRLYRTAEERSLAAHPRQTAALRILQSVKLPDDPKSKKVVDDLRHTIGVHGTSFADYLQFRVSDLGVQSQRFAEAIWILEIGLGSLAGTWIFRRLAPASRLEASEVPAKLDE